MEHSEKIFGDKNALVLNDKIKYSEAFDSISISSGDGRSMKIEII